MARSSERRMGERETVDRERLMKSIPLKGSTPAKGHGIDPGKLSEVKVTANAQVTAGIFRLSFPRTFDFVPGQLVALTVDPAVPARFYSIASGNAEPMVEILYDLVPHGLLTPRFAQLGPGDSLYVSPPFGRFMDAEGPRAGSARARGSLRSSPWSDRAW